jgi:hypothetical protein
MAFSLFFIGLVSYIRTYLDPIGSISLLISSEMTLLRESQKFQLQSYLQRRHNIAHNYSSTYVFEQTLSFSNFSKTDAVILSLF